MGKKKGFVGDKIDVKEVLREDPVAKAATVPAWSQGAGAARAAKPAKAAAVPAKVAVSKAAVPGSALAKPPCAKASNCWAKGGPLGLAATSAAVQGGRNSGLPAQRPPAPPRAVPPNSGKPSLGLRQQSVGYSEGLGNEDFPEVERPKTQTEIAKGKELALAADAFPATDSGDAALAALCKAAAVSGIDCGGDISSKLAACFRYLLKALVDNPKEQSRERMLCAGGHVINLVSEEPSQLDAIQGLLEAYFVEQQANGKNTPQVLEANGLIDARLLGEVGRHLDPSSSKYASIRMRLVRRLTKSTTPHVVQRSLADALTPMFASSADAAELACKGFLKELASAHETSRRGAALGVAAIIRASGTSAVKKFGVMEMVKEAAATEGKNAAARRQGALLCLGALAEFTGRSFEPYALSSMPLLLASCADSSREVRLAGRAAAQTVVTNVTATGMKLLVNPLLEGLRDKRWRGQLSALELLEPLVAGLLSEQPKRLVALLPRLVPALCDAAIGTHREVREAAKAVFDVLGAAVSGHQDVAALAPKLLAALSDPGEAAVATAMEALLSAVFTTSLDAPACALICPVVSRALARGDADIKRAAAGFCRALVQLIGEADELTPYLTALWPQLQLSLSEPAPGLRLAAAQAVGCLAACFEEEELGWGAAFLSRLDTGCAQLSDHAGTQPATDETELEGAALGLAMCLGTARKERRTEIVEQLLAEQDRGRRLNRWRVFKHLPRSLVGMAEDSDTVSVLARYLSEMETALGDSDDSIRSLAHSCFSSAILKATPPVAILVAGHLESALQAEEAHARISAAELAIELLPSLNCSSEARVSLMVTAVVSQSDAVGEVRKAADRLWRAALPGNASASKVLKDLRPQLFVRIRDACCSDNNTLAAKAGRSAVQLSTRLGSNDRILSDVIPYVAQALERNDRPLAQRSVCAYLLEITRSDSAAEAVFADTSLTGSLHRAMMAEDVAVRLDAARCAVRSPLSSVMRSFIDSVCSPPKCPTSGELRGLEALLVSDEDGFVFTALLQRASKAQYTGALCLTIAHVAPQTVLRSNAAALAAACLASLRCSCDENVAGKMLEHFTVSLAAVSKHLDEESVGEACDTLTVEIGAGGCRAQGQAAALLLAALLGAAPAVPSSTLSTGGLLDRLLTPAALLDKACATAGRGLVQACGEAVVGQMADRLRDAFLAAEDVHNHEDLHWPSACWDAWQPALHHALTRSGVGREAAAEAQTVLLRRVDQSVVEAGAVKCAGPLVRLLSERPLDPGLQIAVLGSIKVLFRRASTPMRSFAPPLQAALLRLLEQLPEGTAQSLEEACIATLGVFAAAAPRPEPLFKALCKAPPHATRLHALQVTLAASPCLALSSDMLHEVRTIAERACASPDDALRSVGAALLRAPQVGD